MGGIIGAIVSSQIIGSVLRRNRHYSSNITLGPTWKCSCGTKVEIGKNCQYKMTLIQKIENM